jgi:hypothetical protein
MQDRPHRTIIDSGFDQVPDLAGNGTHCLAFATRSPMTSEMLD